MNRHRVRVGLVAAIALLVQTTRRADRGPGRHTGGISGAGVTVDQFAVVTPGSRTNQGWDQQGADAADEVAESLGIESIVAENAGYEDITPILRDLVASGADLISCHASGYQTLCAEFAAESNVPVAVTELQSAIVPGLVSSIDPLAHEAAYLAGVLAGGDRDRHVGVVVSGEPPTWNYMTVGFAEGLKATNPDAQLLYSVIGEAAYDDAAGAKRVTEQQLAANADVIFGMGDGASFGMIQAIEEHNAQEGATRAWFIDVIGDKTAEHGDVLLSSVLFDYSGVYEQMIDDLAAGTFGKSYVMNVENEGVRLLEPPEEISQEAKDAVAAAQEQIVGGEIEVPAVGDAAEMQARLASSSRSSCAHPLPSPTAVGEGAPLPSQRERGWDEGQNVEAAMTTRTTWPRLNLAAGPVQVTDQTLRDAARPILYHYDPAFIELFARTSGLLQEVFRTKYDVVIMQGEAILGLEAAAAGLLSPGDKVLNLVSGSSASGSRISSTSTAARRSSWPSPTTTRSIPKTSARRSMPTRA